MSAVANSPPHHGQMQLVRLPVSASTCRWETAGHMYRRAAGCNLDQEAWAIAVARDVLVRELWPDRGLNGGVARDPSSELSLDPDLLGVGFRGDGTFTAGRRAGDE
mmetsp:Transcript_62787/g.182093  ORF Transcript_62787/g.182093 Transcript_62787/m.182093 type:complete len:106 (-) Transcript_62787:1220-1537(-)